MTAGYPGTRSVAARDLDRTGGYLAPRPAAGPFLAFYDPASGVPGISLRAAPITVIMACVNMPRPRRRLKGGPYPG